VLAASAATGAQSPPAASQDAKTVNLSAYVELLRSDIRTQKVAIITEVMGFTEAESTKFWPVYREYEAEMSTLGDERAKLIADYARAYDSLTDALADTLATKALDLEARRQAAKAKCYERVKAALSPRTALRFIQVEHQLQQLIDLQISATLPVAPVEGKRQP
jgi:phage-related minor tail protein